MRKRSRAIRLTTVWFAQANSLGYGRQLESWRKFRNYNPNIENIPYLCAQNPTFMEIGIEELERLREAVEQKAGRKMEVHGDYEYLAELIF